MKNIQEIRDMFDEVHIFVKDDRHPDVGEIGDRIEDSVRELLESAVSELKKKHDKLTIEYDHLYHTYTHLLDKYKTLEEKIKNQLANTLNMSDIKGITF